MNDVAGSTVRSRVSQQLRWAIEILLLAMIAVSPWAFACTRPQDAFFLYLGTAILLALWALRVLIEWRFTWALCPVALGLGGLILLNMLQWYPLPAGLLEKLSPTTVRLYAELLPADGELLPTGQPRLAIVPPAGSTISLYPNATRRVLLRLLAVLAVFSVVRNNLQTTAFLRRLSVVAVVNGGLLALFALIQFFTSADTHIIYWSFPAPGSVFGPFGNRNHFAFYINICIGLGLGLLLSWGMPLSKAPSIGRAGHLPTPGPWSADLLHDPRALWVSVTLALMLACVPLCLSRGGTAALLASLAVWSGIVFAQRGQFSRTDAGLVAVFVALMLLTWFGWDPIIARVSTLWSGELIEDAGRYSFWSRAWPLIRDFPVWGTGAGTFKYVESLYLHVPEQAAGLIEYAHNDYLEAQIEGGVVRLSVTLAIVALVFWYGYRALRIRKGRSSWGIVLGALFGLTTTAGHAFVEFGMQMPAIALLVVVLAASVSSLGQTSRSERPVRAPGPIVAAGFGRAWAGVVPIVATVMMLGLALILVQQSRRAVVLEYYTVTASELRKAYPVSSLPRRISLLNRAVRAVPADAEAHLALGRAQLALLNEAAQRAAAVAGKKREILRQTLLVPGLRHLLEARDLCPVWAAPHVQLATYVAQLKRADPRRVYIQRAKRLVPEDPLLWYTAGLEDLAAGRTDQAWADWRRALTMADTHLDLILNRAAGQLTPQEILQHILPDRPEPLLKAARRLFPDPQAIELRRPFLERALDAWRREADPQSADDLYTKAEIYRQLGEFDQTLDLLEHALLVDPNGTAWRYEYAQLLYEQGRLHDAFRELDVLLDQQPKHGSGQKLREKIAHEMAAGRSKSHRQSR